MAYLSDIEIEEDEMTFVINTNEKLKTGFVNGLRRISKPGLRVYSRKGEVPRYFGGLGVTIVSTSNGIMTHKQAWKERLGGEVMCVVW